MKSIPEGLNKTFEILLIARKEKKRKSNLIKIENILLATNIFNYLFNIYKTFKNQNTKYLLISITPYSFVACLLLLVFRKNFFVYLRSNGYEEYRCFSKFFGPFIYHIMFTIVSWKATLISCRKHILMGKTGHVVSPSQLNERWFSRHLKPDLSKINLLYVGRLNVVKGIFSLLEILKNLKINFLFSIVSTDKKKNDKINQENIKVINFKNEHESIIKLYDSHNIFILPSFTEGHPQVLDESLSRLRPVILFEEISHVIRNREGVFVCKRNSQSLSETIKYVMDNYSLIQEKMSKNILPTKENFLNELSLILNK
jgi:glycosyltransferase involved in cell wall biosynthesis